MRYSNDCCTWHTLSGGYLPARNEMIAVNIVEVIEQENRGTDKHADEKDKTNIPGLQKSCCRMQ